MKKMLAVSLLTLISFDVSALPSFAAQCKQAVRGFDNEILNTDQQMLAAYCLGYVSGVRDVDHTNGNHKYCISKGTTQESLVRVVSKYMDENPSKLDRHKVLLVDEALRESYNCHKTP